MTLGQILAVVLLAMATSAAGTWQVQDWRMGKQLAEQGAQFQTDLGLVSAVAAKQVSDEQGRRLALEKTLATSDQQHTRELSDAQRNQVLLRDRLATADMRLSVLLDATDSASYCNVPAASASSGVVHGPTRAQLDPAHAQRIIGITDAGDQGLIALRACQDYAKEVSIPK
ncbi:lysis protein [Pseudomonas hygromyciniae]|uniref:Lysis protein n=1 Tax=Pseudomonas hygromyciniae TaxID=2812000 RepID=A0ABX7K3D0_9PSED|nr:lysis system i-spanin subunit Rz [Pseudomonas hygromyciniae]MBN0978908.1 lysis protein [Pseudomonas hygromyciniae]QSB41848.1 lysis protein [Pseudomonas hygromyciniae]